MAALLAWFFFFIYRKKVETGSIDFDQIAQDSNFYLGLLIIPILWLIAYTLFDKYNNLYRLSRISTVFRTLALSFFGALFLFFTVLSDDLTFGYVQYFKPLIVLLLLHFSLTILFRIVWLSICKNNIRSGKVSFNTLIIGQEPLTNQLISELAEKKNWMGHHILGSMPIDDSTLVQSAIPQLGTIAQLEELIGQFEIEDVILALGKEHRNQAEKLIQELNVYDDLVVKIIPDMHDMMLGHVRMNHIYGAPFIELHQALMPTWQWAVKRIMDVVLSLIGILFLSPLMLFSALRVKLGSKGPILFRQERVGRNGKPFNILKFRSMIEQAENNGPQLSYDTDPRITAWGKTMRKWRLDELPQFFNVIKGDMSLVGPRPERQYYIDRLSEDIPHFNQLLKVRPGITSWGQVKYGYASTIEQMKQRFSYDMLYLENMSIALDIKILFYTIIVLFQGKGK